MARRGEESEDGVDDELGGVPLVGVDQLVQILVEHDVEVEEAEDVDGERDRVPAAGGERKEGVVVEQQLEGLVGEPRLGRVEAVREANLEEDQGHREAQRVHQRAIGARAPE